MIELLVLLSIIVTTIFLTGIAAALGSENQHSGRKDYYGPAKMAEEMHHPILLGTAQGAGMGGVYGGGISSRKRNKKK